MFLFLTGGSASGKSRWAEGFSAALHRRDGGALIYLATMSAGDGESRARIARHRRQRAGKGFLTLERPAGLAELVLPPDATVLLEDVGNLCANELYSPGGGGVPAAAAGLESLIPRVRNLVVVGNELSSAGEDWRGMADYLEAVARAQILCAARADAAGEVLCGLPLWHKLPHDFHQLLQEVTPRWTF